MNRAKKKGWAQGIPTSNPGKEKELLGEWIHPANTIASCDEIAMNRPGGCKLLRTSYKRNFRSHSGLHRY